MGASRLRVGMVIASALTIALGVVVAPSVASAAASAPTGLSPNDPNSAPTASGAGTPIKNVVLTWSAVSGAGAYEVQVSDSNGSFDDPAISQTTTLTSFAPSSSLPRGDYAWRVKAVGGAWSSTAYLTRGWTQAPTNPHALDPSGFWPSGQYAGFPYMTGVALSWNALPDASYYEVQLSPTPFIEDNYEDAGAGASEGIKIQTCYTASTVFTTYQAKVGKDTGIRTAGATNKCTEFLGGPWYWRVRGRDGTFDPAKSNVTMPAAGCTGVWYASTAPETDQVDECSAWAYPTVKGIIPVDSRYGAVRPAPAIPANPDLSPRAGANVNPVQVTSTPVFHWDHVGTVTDVDFYRVYQSRTPRLDTHDHMWETQSNSLSPALQEPDRDVRYYWAVQACVDNSERPDPVEDEDGEVLEDQPADYVMDFGIEAKIVCGQVSAWHSYVKKTPATVVAQGSAPVQGGNKFTWTTAIDTNKPNTDYTNAVSDVMGYQVQFSDNFGSFDRPSRTVNVDRQGTVAGTTSASVPAAGLPTGYKWRVRGIDSSGNAYPWSNERLVGQLAAAKGSLAVPSGSSLKAPFNFSFTAPVRGVSSASARIVATSNNKAVPGTVSKITDSKYQFKPSVYYAAGESYRLSLTPAVETVGTDTPAVASQSTVRAPKVVDSASPALRKVAGDYGWSTARASDASGKTYLRSDDRTSTARRSYVQTTVRGSKLNVYACMGKSSGKARIYVDGKTRATVDLYKSTSKCGKVATISLTSGSQHTVRFAALGTKSKKSSSTRVRFDAFAVV